MSSITLTNEDAAIRWNLYCRGHVVSSKQQSAADRTDYRVMRDHFELKQKSGFTPDERIRQFTTWDQVSA